MIRDMLSYGAGTLVAIAIVAGLVFLFISDITQKKHGVLRNYPVVGHLRYFFEELGEYFRQYFFYDLHAPVYPYAEPKARIRAA